MFFFFTVMETLHPYKVALQPPISLSMREGSGEGVELALLPSRVSMYNPG